MIIMKILVLSLLVVLTSCASAPQKNDKNRDVASEKKTQQMPSYYFQMNGH